MSLSATKETLIGAVTIGILLAVVLGNAVHHRTEGEGRNGYTVEAVFQRAEGLAPGAEVRLSGVPVGEVLSQNLDAHFQSHAQLLIESKIPIPLDSAVTIETDGLLGPKYIEVQAGGSDDSWKDGTVVDLGLTQGSIAIQDLLARIVAQAQARHAAARAASLPSQPGTSTP